MGTTLTGLTPATTYDALIKVGDNGPLSATAKYVGDGLGNDSVVALSTSSVGIGTTSPTQLLHVAGNVRITGALYDGNNAAGTSGQILSSTGTGTDWVSKSDLSLVDGSGTANYVSKWSDTDTLTNSVIYDNGTKVGIGTTSPNSKLDIVQTSNAEAFRVEGAAGGFAFLVDGGTSYKTIIRNASIGNSYGGTAAPSNGLIVEGNVGIGTSSPNAKLEVQAPTLGTTSGNTAYASIFSGNNGNSASLEIKDIRTANGSDWTSAGKRLQMKIDSVYMGYIQFNGNSNNSGISFATGSTTDPTGNVDERMRIDSSGNLSITTGNIALSGAGGIFFDSGASKYLDDYEVGTWTPVLRQNATNNTATYTLQTGTYTKIGNIITVFFDIATSSVTAGSGFLNIGGLPYTVSGSLAGFSYGGVRAATILDGSLTNAVAGVFAQRSDSYLRIIATDTTDGQEFDPAAYAASGRITGTIQYTV